MSAARRPRNVRQNRRTGAVTAAAMAFLLLVLATSACSSDAASPTLGFDEPLRARAASSGTGQPRAQFRQGTPPVIADGPTTTLETPGDVVLPPGKVGKQFLGFASQNAVAIGLRFRDFGSGYWIVPTGAPDRTQNPPAVGWRAEVDIGYQLPPGLTALRAYAIDDAGRAGPPTDTTVCLTPPVPDNLASCDSSLKPPNIVLSLSWDTNVDLDLQLVTPSGKILGPGKPTTHAGDGGTATPGPDDPGVGNLEFDSMRGCTFDGRRRENVVWQGRPEPGQYAAYANLFDACGSSSVRFNFDVYLAGQPAAAGELNLQRRVPLGSGYLLAVDANGGANLGLFIAQFTLE